MLPPEPVLARPPTPAQPRMASDQEVIAAMGSRELMVPNSREIQLASSRKAPIAARTFFDAQPLQRFFAKNARFPVPKAPAITHDATGHALADCHQPV
jgi:hypothetical protein